MTTHRLNLDDLVELSEKFKGSSFDLGAYDGLTDDVLMTMLGNGSIIDSTSDFFYRENQFLTDDLLEYLANNLPDIFLLGKWIFANFNVIGLQKFLKAMMKCPDKRRYIRIGCLGEVVLVEVDRWLEEPRGCIITSITLRDPQLHKLYFVSNLKRLVVV